MTPTEQASESTASRNAEVPMSRIAPQHGHNHTLSQRSKRYELLSCSLEMDETQPLRGHTGETLGGCYLAVQETQGQNYYSSTRELKIFNINGDQQSLFSQMCK